MTEKRQCGRCGSFGRLRSPENLRRYGVYGCCECVEKKDDIAEYERLIKTGKPVDLVLDKRTIDDLAIDIKHPYLQRTLINGGRVGIFGENLSSFFRQMARNCGYMTKELGEGGSRIQAINDVVYAQDIDRALFVGYRGLAAAPALDAYTQLGGTAWVYAEGDHEKEWNEIAPLVRTVSPEYHPRRPGKNYGNAAGVRN
ncbi:hypothetical protein OAJ45_02955 [Candidatus Poseidoniales archaeon]|nr:hypothetical protein [Candidatus Poseidoniales archaeon]